MNAQQLIDVLVKESPAWTQNRLGAKLGLTSQAMANRMSRSDAKVSFLADALEALGYDLVAVPSGSRLPNGSHRVDGR